MTDVPEYEANIKAFKDAHDHLVKASEELVLAQGQLRRINASKEYTMVLEYAKYMMGAIEKVIVEQVDCLDDLSDVYDDANKPEGYDEGVA